MGIASAFIALVAWGFADFLIQRNTRKFGNVLSLFFITLLGTILLFPFVFSDVAYVFEEKIIFWVLFFVSAIFLGASLLQFEALRRGKLSVVEPIFAFELPITALLAVALIQEFPSSSQIIFLIILLIGIILVSIRTAHAHIKLEAGIFFALGATAVMALINLFFGALARITDPFLVIWSVSAWITATLLVYLWFTRGLRQAIYDLEHHKNQIFPVGILNTVAWTAFAYSMTQIPIAVATGITESYIALSAVLGILINKELLERHQKVGLVLAIGSAILLAVVTR